MSTMSDEEIRDDLKLIGLIRMHPNIYAQSRRDFRDLQMKKDSWETISRQMKRTVQQCQRHFKSLRDKFGREKKLIGTSSEYSAWPMYSAMIFLSPYVQERHRGKLPADMSVVRIQAPTVKTEEEVFVEASSVKTEDSTVTTEVVNMESVYDTDLLYDESIDPSASDMSNPISDSPLPHPPAAKRPKVYADVESTMAVISRTMESITTALTARSKEDANDLFGRYVGLKLKKMSRKRKIEAKIKIVQLVECDTDSE